MLLHMLHVVPFQAVHAGLPPGALRRARLEDGQLLGSFLDDLPGVLALQGVGLVESWYRGGRGGAKVLRVGGSTWAEASGMLHVDWGVLGKRGGLSGNGRFEALQHKLTEQLFLLSLLGHSLDCCFVQSGQRLG